MNWITLALIAITVTIALTSTESAFATNGTSTKQLSLDEVFATSGPAITEVKIIDDLKKLEETVGFEVTEEEVAKKSHVIQELLATYDELLDPSVIAEIQKGDVVRAHNIVKIHTEKISDVVKITPTNNIQKDGIVGSVSSLNQFIPKQMSMLDIFG